MPLTKPRLAEEDNFDLGVLSLGERLFLWRHRGNGMSQPEAARALGLEPGLYHRIENGDRVGAAFTAEEMIAVAERLDRAGTVEPTPGDLCLIARRRSGRALTTVLAALGISRPTLYAWERAADPRLVTYWRARGFTFPQK